MKFKLIILLVGTTFLGSCSQRKKIEIYLTKENVLSYNTIPVLDADRFKQHLDSLSETIRLEEVEYYKYKVYDTIKDKVVGKGKYLISKIPLEDYPIVFDEEIQSLNLINNELKIEESGINRIIKSLEPKFLRDGQQFVLTYDGIPIFGGYFVSGFSNGSVNWYSIQVLFGESKFNQTISIDKCYCSNADSKLIPELNKQHALIEAFRATNRLIE